MAGQTLETIIKISAEVGSGFSSAGSVLTELGNTINGVSQQLINFGKESVEVYRQYELSMADAEVALSTIYGRNSSELNRVMDQLNASATEWAATTIFHTDDVANAISEAAHAGWNLEEIMNGIPAAMQLAQAGGLDLSEAVNYIVKSTNAAGIEMDDMSHFIDIWTFAANSSASTVGEFGDAMLKMGNTMRFAANSEELMTLIAVTANAGSTGEAAGTLIRNSMMRLVAPTAKAKTAMADLGATSEETAALLEDEALAAANAELAAHGFSVYDENGQMKSVLEIYRELYVALGEIAGGYEDIEHNAVIGDVLAKIFPTRTITEALALLSGAANGYEGLYEAMMGGDATGYGEYSATTMMQTLNGEIETFESKVERLKQLVGGELSTDVTTVVSGLGSFVDSLATMDPDLFSALVSGLEVIAAAGPTLITAGAGLALTGKIITTLGVSTAATGFLGLAIGVAAYAVAINDLYNSHYIDMFGENGLDTTMLTQHVGKIETAFKDANSEVSKFKGYIDDCVKGYTEASTSLNSSLVTALATGVTIEEGSDEYNNLMKAGETMTDALIAGIESKRGLVLESLMSTKALGGEGDEQTETIWQQIMAVVNQGFDDEVGKAEALSQQLRDAMTSAFDDGLLTSEELGNIQAIFDQMNEMMAKIQDRENYLEKQRLLRKSQTMGLDEVNETLNEISALKNKEREELLSSYDQTYYDTQYMYQQALQNGGVLTMPDGSTQIVTEEDMQAALQVIRDSQNEAEATLLAGYEEMMAEISLERVRESELSEAWNAAEQLMVTARNNGGTLSEADLLEWNKYITQSENVGKYLQTTVDYLGGVEQLQFYADYFNGKGLTDQAQKYTDLLDMYNLFFTGGAFNNPSSYKVTEFSGDVDPYTTFLSLLGESWADTDIKEAEIREALTSGAFSEDGFSWYNILGDELYGKLTGQATLSGVSLTDWIAGALGLSGTTTFAADLADINAQIEEVQTSIELAKSSGDMGYMDSVLGPLEEKLTNLLEKKAELEAAAGSGVEVVYTVNDDAVQEYEPPDKTGTVTYGTGSEGGGEESGGNFAEGGRATTASIFGEAGAEWAIPEEHSSRTAGLLNAARKASGFTWQELISSYGGLNADVKGSTRTLVYSPTINTTDASGLETVLMNDKRRLEKMLNDRQMRDEAEVYA